MNRRVDETVADREVSYEVPNPAARQAPKPVDENDRDAAARPNRRGRFILIAIGVVIAIVIVVALRKRSATQAQTSKEAAAAGRNRASTVAVVPVEQRDVPVYLDGLGNVNALNTVTVKTRIDGQLERFNFQEGQMVHAGEELALIDPRPSEAALAQAQATKFRDEATLENTKRDLQRFADLYKAGVIPQQQYNTQQSQLAVNEGSVKADAAQVQNAQLNVSYCHIKSPIDGRIGIRSVDPGNMVHASDSNGLIVITQLQPIAVLFTVPEDSLPAVAQHMRGGLPVEAWSRDSTQKLADGRLLTIDNQIDPNTGTFRCKAVFDNKDGALFPNQFVNARLRVDVRHNALTVPAAAVQHGSQGTYIYVVRPDKTVDARPVAIVMTEGTTSVLGGGVNPGDQVVTDGADKLQPHGKVEIAGAGGGRGGAGKNGGAGKGAPGAGAARRKQAGQP